jgi:hypothetical protein
MGFVLLPRSDSLSGIRRGSFRSLLKYVPNGIILGLSRETLLRTEKEVKIAIFSTVLQDLASNSGFYFFYQKIQLSQKLSIFVPSSPGIIFYKKSASPAPNILRESDMEIMRTVKQQPIPPPEGKKYPVHERPSRLTASVDREMLGSHEEQTGRPKLAPEEELWLKRALQSRLPIF